MHFSARSLVAILLAASACDAANGDPALGGNSTAAGQVSNGQQQVGAAVGGVADQSGANAVGNAVGVGAAANPNAANQGVAGANAVNQGVAGANAVNQGVAGANAVNGNADVGTAAAVAAATEVAAGPGSLLPLPGFQAQTAGELKPLPNLGAVSTVVSAVQPALTALVRVHPLRVFSLNFR